MSVAIQTFAFPDIVHSKGPRSRIILLGLRARIHKYALYLVPKTPLFGSTSAEPHTT